MKTTCLIKFFLFSIILLSIKTPSSLWANGMQYDSDSNIKSDIKYSFLAHDTGVIVLRSIELKQHKLSIRISSNGCTHKKTIKSHLNKSDEVNREVPHYEITFIREKPDRCKAFIPEGNILIYDLKEDFGINTKLPYTVSIKNPIYPLLEDEPYFQFYPKREERPQPVEKGIFLKEQLIRATVRAIEMEIKRHDANDYRYKEQEIEELKRELEKFKKMNPEDYILESSKDSDSAMDILNYGPVMPPIQRHVEILIEEPLEVGSMLKLTKMTKSGPFYHIAGINENLANELKQGRYKLKIYLVYKRKYFGFIPNYYVYLAEIEK